MPETSVHDSETTKKCSNDFNLLFESIPRFNKDIKEGPIYSIRKGLQNSYWLGGQLDRSYWLLKTQQSASVRAHYHFAQYCMKLLIRRFPQVNIHLQQTVSAMPMKMLFQIQERITPEMLGTISRLAAFEMHIIRQVSILSTVIMTRWW